MKKVLILTGGGDVGGAKPHILGMCELLNRREPGSVLMVSFREGEFAEEARQRGIPTVVMSFGFLSEVRQLKALVRSGEFDIIHSHGSRANFMAALCNCGLPTVSTIHSDYKLDYLGRPLANLTYGLINRIALRRLRYFIGVTNAMSSTLLERGFAPERIFTIHNGIEINGSLPERRGASDETVIGIAARLNPVKDIATLIRAFAKLKGQALRLRIAGDGAEETKLRQLAAELSVEERVEFLGWVTDMDAFYRTLDINVLCSVSETFPYSLLEGAKAGIATVSSEVGGVANMIDDDVNGYLFRAGDSDALAEHLQRYVDDEELRELHGNLLHAKVACKFSLDAMVDTQLAIYSRIRRLSGGSGKRRGVAICGAYGMGNVGDEAILTSIIAAVREADEDAPIYVLSKSPKQTMAAHMVRAAHTFNIFSFFRVAGKSRLYLNGGGSLIQDETSRRSLWFYLYTIIVAKLRGAKVMMYGCGIGPVTKPFDRKLARNIINRYVDAITLREDGSLAELKAFGVTKPSISLSADPVFALSDAERFDSSSKQLAVTLREWKGVDGAIPAVAKTLEYAYNTYGLTPVFLPIDRKDAEVNAEVASLLPQGIPRTLLEPLDAPAKAIEVMSAMRAALSMRLHGLIFGAAVGLPLIGIVYDPKVSNFLEYIGQPNYCKVGDVTTERLNALLDTVMSSDCGSEKDMQELEKVNSKVLREMLKKNEFS